MSEVEADYVVNTVSAFALVLSGLLTIALSLMMTRQPFRWLVVYICVALSGAAAIWYHGFGSTFPAHVADVGASLLLVWMIQVAIVGDLYPGRPGRLVNLIVGLANLECILTLIAGGAKGNTSLYFGPFVGFTFGELMLTLNCAVAVILIFGRRDRVDAAARPLLNLVTLLFLVGLPLAAASGRGVEFGVIAYHAGWHIVGAIGFIAFWALNEMRFSLVAYAEDDVVAEVAPDEGLEVVFSPEGEIFVRPGVPAGWARASQG